MPTDERYVPAAGRSWLTALYDPLVALTMRERTFRPALMAAVLSDPRPGVVLDLGCGTGTFAGQLAEADPSGQVLSVDGDELARARRSHVLVSACVSARAWSAACRSRTHRSTWWSRHFCCTTFRRPQSWRH